ncbi:MAG: nitric-oxide reductase large subunit [Pirellulales bacterium]|nr:nitric-oxide reductase large subunit [Pirellulales bacterium]
MRRLWVLFAVVLVLSFLVLGWIGARIYQVAPPMADRVVTTDGKVVIDSGQINQGQHVWQSLGGMEVGSIWGHGSYVAPDWTADWLHREAVFVLDRWGSAQFGKKFAELDAEQQAQLTGRLTEHIRKNTYDPATRTITIDPLRAEAFEANWQHYTDVFSNGRAAYAIPQGAVTESGRLRALSAFVFWTAWAATTNRPDDTVSYTQNWPHEQLVGNVPSGEAVVWTGVSIIMLLAGISAMAWWHASKNGKEEKAPLPQTDPLGAWTATPSQKATIKYFWVVTAMMLLQMTLGVVTAHYGVEGDGFYGIPVSKWIPYAVSRTWHLQLGILWIATAWLGAGLFIGPLVSEVEPKGQRLGVNVLFVALVVVVVGSLTGQWLSIQNKLPSDAMSFYFGHQGYEYVDLGRIWQIALLAGLLLWLFLVVRVLRPALRKGGESKQLVALLLVSTTAIALFYAAGLGWGRHTNLTIVEYWRWWVVHLWVEGFFEVFATTVIAFFFMRLGLIRPGVAAAAALMSATIFLSGGIIGTCHHLYFSGTPTAALAWGSVFSALEVVPLVLVGFEATEDFRRSRVTPWVRKYKWPIYFFVAVAFWNMVGAGLFGFMINPPIALYYMQGLNTTPLHGHSALFGVYGMLGIGLMLVCLRALIPGREWRDGLLKFSFWALNIGLLTMCVLSLLPVGLMQTKASVENGYWYARSSEFMQTSLMQTLRWMRVPGDTIFFLGALALALFIVGLKTGHSFSKKQSD